MGSSTPRTKTGSSGSSPSRSSLAGPSTTWRRIFEPIYYDLLSGQLEPQASRGSVPFGLRVALTVIDCGRVGVVASVGRPARLALVGVALAVTVTFLWLYGGGYSGASEAADYDAAPLSAPMLDPD